MRAAALLLAASLLLCAAAAARAGDASCVLGLDKAEVDRLGAALAASPKTFLTYAADGKTITGVKADALRAHGFSDAAIKCMEATYSARTPASGTGSVPVAPAPGLGISNADRDKARPGRPRGAATWGCKKWGQRAGRAAGGNTPARRRAGRPKRPASRASPKR
jgi:hypothetical protein